ncbi:regulator of G-protein signaling 22-like isoform X3 [Liolophura sinensis]
MFVDYFNTFLALPSFPEPVCFNAETGGFEVVSKAKKELARQIKTVVRAQQRKPKIYMVTKNHSYSDIPLIPIEDPPETSSPEINTTFSVQTLNKEQGIHWIKAERMPLFLESQCYLEYRLANILAQVQLTGSHGQYVSLKIDVSHQAKARAEEPKEVKVDPLETLKKKLYVCMGNTSSTISEAWFSSAKLAQDTDPTFVTSTRPSSAIGMVTPCPSGSARRIRPYSARPLSALSTSDDRYGRDSGIGSSTRGSVFGSTLNISAYASSVASIEEEEGGASSRILKPCTPRPSEPICSISGADVPRGVVYMPHHKGESTDSESGVGDIDTDRDDDVADTKFGTVSTSQSTKTLQSSTNQKTSTGVIKSIDELSSVIVGDTLAKIFADVRKMEFKKAQRIPEIGKVYPSEEHMNINVNDFDSFDIDLDENRQPEKPASLNCKPKSEDSDADSLLDSEDDFEEQDTFFRRPKPKVMGLSSKKGIEEFKSFIAGTHGEIYWNLWLDIDKCFHMTDPQCQIKYAHKLREKYQSPSAIYPLTNEMTAKFGLSQPEGWTPQKLKSIQTKVAEPLVTYWARRYLLQQERPMTAKKLQYQGELQAREHVRPVNAVTKGALLPLRPKSCHPRIRQVTERTPSEGSAEMQEQTELKTSPPVGMRRTYSSAAIEKIQRAFNMGKGKDIANQTSDVKKKPERSLPQLPSGKKKLPTPPTSKPVSRDRRPKTACSIRTKSALSSVTEGRSSLTNESPREESGGKGDKSASRCSSARSSRSSSSRSSSSQASSVFLGGQRMECLLQALHHERGSGGFFKRFVEKSNNSLWRNNLKFWCAVQEYHQAFCSQSLDHAAVQRKAKIIFSLYIVGGAPRDIGCSADIRAQVYCQLDPPFEELFDSAEEYTIEVLYGAWTQLLASDNKSYSKVELIEVKRHLETKSKYVLNLRKRGLISERVLTPEDPMEGYEDPVYDESLLEKIPEEFRDYSLDKLIHNRLELEQFRQFLNANYASMDLMCWMEIESFRRLPHTEEKKRDAKAKDINAKYLNKKYFFGANSPAGKEGQDKVIEVGGGWGKLLEDRPPNPVLLEAQKYVQERLEKKWLPQFLALPEFMERQKPVQTMDNVIDDVIVQKRHKSQAVLKDLGSDCSDSDLSDMLEELTSTDHSSQMLESRWVTSSGDIMTFRKALLNPITSLQFRRYISIKGDSLENDVLFWLEVQKYKELHHTNTDDSTLLHKINAIINCFLDSPIPPSLQVDIPQETADKIIDRKYEKGPYLFRDAQLIVFRVLFSHWNEFCEYRTNLAPDKVLPTIERQRRRVKKKERERQQRLEEQREKQILKRKEAARRQALGLPLEGDYDEPDNFHDPFATKAEGSEVGDDPGSAAGKDSISWTYSQYMAALQAEDILNHLDESSLSSFTETGSLKPLEKDRLSGSAQTDTLTKADNKSESPPSSKRSKKDFKSGPNSLLDKEKNNKPGGLKTDREARSDRSFATSRSGRTTKIEAGKSASLPKPMAKTEASLTLTVPGSRRKHSLSRDGPTT